ncbi:MAG: bifunctional acetate--CoA ligase family protein/GNAT family N-acetyltransferase [Solirubrobacteraceae bacterium]
MTTTADLPYPAEREADVVLRDGSTVHVRPVRPTDRDAMHSFLSEVSEDAIWFRFFSMADLGWATKWALNVDYRDRFGLVVETGSPRRIIAHAAYVRIDPASAEVAFLVSDAWQGHGIATILLAHLAESAAANGVMTFVADVLPDNHKMIRVFRESGFAVDVHRTPDAIRVEFPTSLSPEAAARFYDRDRIASVAAVTGVLAPRSVVVVGASRRRGTVGGELLRNVAKAGFTGDLYAVNEHGGSIHGIEAHRSLADLPGPAELAVIVVPADRVVPAARESIAAGAHALVVISAGFAEVGGAGVDRQRELLELCRASGVRLVGPNCLGVLNTRPEVRLNATFVPHQATAGTIAFLSQSGGLGIAIIEAAARLGVGLSSFVSVGNKADLSSNDFLQYWEQDASTSVALLYLESFGNPRKFARVARRFCQTKPVVAVKSGRSAAGLRGTASHTGALLAASDITVDALFRQAGVIRTDTLAEMFDVAAFLSKQPVPAGHRVAIVTNAGGPGIVCADACQAAGVEVPEPSPALTAELAQHLPPAASVANPIDMIATASADDYRRTLTRLAESGEYDAIVAIFVPPLVTEARDVAAAIRSAAGDAHGCAVAAVFMTAEGPPAELSADGLSVPGYQFPEEAARAAAHAARYGAWRSWPAGVAVTAEPEAVGAGAALIGAELGAGEEWMSPAAVDELLRIHGVAQAPARVVGSVSAAVTAARDLGWPVALKAVARGLIHKRDAGAVATSLRTPAEVRRAARTMQASVTAAGFQVQGFVVQQMIPDGVELLVGMVQDASFGPVLACGAGGTNTELFKDVAVRITPVTDRDAAEMVRSLQLYPMLTGFRGSAPCDVAAVESVLIRVGAMVDAHPEIAELDCNPVIVRSDGAVVVDARVRLQEPAPARPVPSVGL